MALVHTLTGMSPRVMTSGVTTMPSPMSLDAAKYARGLSTALRPGGRLFVVDFSPAADRGPPASMCLAPEVIIAELESAGLSASVSPIAPPWMAHGSRRMSHVVDVGDVSA